MDEMSLSTSDDTVCPRTELFRGVIYCIISDYFKNVKNHGEISERMIFGDSGDTVQHFSFLCDMADFDRLWIRRKVIHAQKADVNWKSMQNIGERVLGKIGLSEYVFQKTKEPQIVKNQMKIIVVAGRYTQVKEWAKNNGVPINNIVYADDKHKLMGLHGNKYVLTGQYYVNRIYETGEFEVLKSIYNWTKYNPPSIDKKSKV